jgi:hypothetical protein
MYIFFKYTLKFYVRAYIRFWNVLVYVFYVRTCFFFSNVNFFIYAVYVDVFSMCTCSFVYVHVCVLTRVCTHIDICIHTVLKCSCVVYGYSGPWLSDSCARERLRACHHVYTYMRMHAQFWSHTHTDTYVHTDINIHMYMYVYVLPVLFSAMSHHFDAFFFNFVSQSRPCDWLFFLAPHTYFCALKWRENVCARRNVSHCTFELWVAPDVIFFQLKNETVKTLIRDQTPREEWDSDRDCNKNRTVPCTSRIRMPSARLEIQVANSPMFRLLKS